MSIVYDIINPFTVNIGQVYLQYRLLFDPIIAFLLFLSLCAFVFKKKYGEGKEGKAVAVAVALALTFAFTVMEMTTGFYFGHPIMQGLAGLFLLLILGILLYELLAMMFGEHHRMCAIAFTYFLVYGTMMSAFSPLYQGLYAQAPIVAAVLGLGFLFAIIAAIICFVRMFSGGGDGHAPAHAGGGHAPAHGAPPHGAAPHAPPAGGGTTGTPISVALTAGGTHFQQGVPVTAVATVHGGSGEYIYQWSEQPDGVHNQGVSRADHVQMLFNNLTVGQHRITIAVIDRSNPANYNGANLDIVVEAPTVTPAAAASLHHRIQQYYQHAQDFATLVHDYSIAGNALLREMRLVFQGAGNLAQLGQAITQFTNIGNALATLVHDLQHEAQDIANDPGFPTLPQADVQLLAQANNVYFVTAANLAAYQQRFQTDYNNVHP